MSYKVWAVTILNSRKKEVEQIASFGTKNSAIKEAKKMKKEWDNNGYIQRKKGAKGYVIVEPYGENIDDEKRRLQTVWFKTKTK